MRGGPREGGKGRRRREEGAKGLRRKEQGEGRGERRERECPRRGEDWEEERGRVE